MSGYTEDEKIEHRCPLSDPKQIKNNGLKDAEISIGESLFVMCSLLHA